MYIGFSYNDNVTSICGNAACEAVGSARRACAVSGKSSVFGYGHGMDMGMANPYLDNAEVQCSTVKARCNGCLPPHVLGCPHNRLAARVWHGHGRQGRAGKVGACWPILLLATIKATILPHQATPTIEDTTLGDQVLHLRSLGHEIQEIAIEAITTHETLNPKPL